MYCIILLAEFVPLVRASLGTAQGRGGALVVDGDATFPALVGGIAHMAKMIPLMRAFGGTSKSGWITFALQQSSTLLAVIVLLSYYP